MTTLIPVPWIVLSKEKRFDGSTVHPKNDGSIPTVILFEGWAEIFWDPTDGNPTGPRRINKPLTPEVHKPGAPFIGVQGSPRGFSSSIIYFQD
jgi:hypothetical protein